MVTVVVSAPATKVQPEDGRESLKLKLSSCSAARSSTMVTTTLAVVLPGLNLTIPDLALKSLRDTAVPGTVVKRTLAVPTGVDRVMFTVTRRSPSLTDCVAAAKRSVMGGGNTMLRMKLLMPLSATLA